MAFPEFSSFLTTLYIIFLKLSSTGASSLPLTMKRRFPLKPVTLTEKINKKLKVTMRLPLPLKSQMPTLPSQLPWQWKTTPLLHSQCPPQRLFSVSAAAGLKPSPSPLLNLLSVHKHPLSFLKHVPSEPNPHQPWGSVPRQTLCASRRLFTSLATSWQHSLLDPLWLGP